MNFDVAIVGSGLAGLTVALNLAQTRRVAVIAKRSMTEGASDWAQGGIAAVLDSADSIENHVRDTLVAGAGLCDEAATRFIVEHGRAAIEWLIAQGVPFTRRRSRTRLPPDARRRPQPSAHHPRGRRHRPRGPRHAAERVRRHPNITLLEDHYAVDLITPPPRPPGRRCYGLYALDLERPHRRRSKRRTRCSPPAAPARSTSTRPTPTPRPATASRWHGARAAAWRTWSSSSSTRPACTTRTRSRS